MSLKKRVVNFYKENIHRGKSFVAKHFLDEKVPKSTVYRLISCAEQGDSAVKEKKEVVKIQKLRLNRT